MAGLFGGGGGSDGEKTSRGQFLELFYEHLHVYPSNADAWWYYKDTEDLFNTDWVARVDVGSTPAPKGHFIFNPFNIARSLTGIPNLPRESSSGLRPTQTAFFAGRIWYAGTKAPRYAQTLYFSQVLNKGVDKVGYCYQEDDPTKPDGGVLVDSDGGTVVIPEIQQVIRLHPYGTALLVIATNGTWTIGGSFGAAFKATDYAVSRISNLGALTAASFVEVDGLPFWWNNDGIYTIQPGPNGSLSVVSLTVDTIQTFYNEIPSASKQYAHGDYNKLTKIIQWVFRSTSASTFDENYRFDKILSLNMITGAFYSWTVCTGDGDPDIIGIVALEGTVSSEEAVEVVVDDVQVQVASEEVDVTQLTPLGIETKFIYPIKGDL